MVLLLIGVAVSAATGAGLLWTLWPNRGASAIKMWLGLVLGLGISAWVYYLGLYAHISGGAGRVAVDGMLLLAVVGLALWRANSAQRRPPLPPPSDAPKTRVTRYLSYSSLISVLMATITLYYWWAYLPYGHQDAWHFWLTKAKFMFYDSGQWQAIFTELPAATHPDYPLLYPATLARLWSYMGQDKYLAGHILSGLFVFALVGLMYSALRHLRSEGQGRLGLLVMIGLNIFWYAAYNQYADLPLALFFLASLIALAIGLRHGNCLGATFIPAGLLAGCAAWTKDEGLLLALSLFVAIGVVGLICVGWRRTLGWMGQFLVGAVPWLLAVVAVKIQSPVGSDLFAGLTIHEAWANVTDFSRHREIIGSVGMMLSEMPENLILPLLVVWALLNLRKPEKSDQRLLAIGAIALVLTAAGHYVVYLIAHDPRGPDSPSWVKYGDPYELRHLKWLLNASLGRLFYQVWPAIVFLVLLAIKTPEEVLVAGKAREQNASTVAPGIRTTEDSGPA